MHARSVLLSALVTVTATALANGPEIGRDASGIFPLASDDVQLVTEHVVIRTGYPWLEPGRATCRYHLRNLSDRDRRLAVAFYVETLDTGMEHPQFGNRLYFHVAQDGVPLPVTVAPVDPARWTHLVRAPQDSLPTWEMTIAAGGDTRLDLSYQVAWSGSPSQWALHYHARPASLWAGVIERATFEVRLDSLTLAEIDTTRAQSGSVAMLAASPPCFTKDGPVLRWEFEQWDATDDIRVTVGHRHPYRSRRR